MDFKVRVAMGRSHQDLSVEQKRECLVILLGSKRFNTKFQKMKKRVKNFAPQNRLIFGG